MNLRQHLDSPDLEALGWHLIGERGEAGEEDLHATHDNDNCNASGGDGGGAVMRHLCDCDTRSRKRLEKLWMSYSNIYKSFMILGLSLNVYELLSCLYGPVWA